MMFQNMETDIDLYLDDCHDDKHSSRSMKSILLREDEHHMHCCMREHQFDQIDVLLVGEKFDNMLMFDVHLFDEQALIGWWSRYVVMFHNTFHHMVEVVERLDR